MMKDIIRVATKKKRRKVSNFSVLFSQTPFVDLMREQKKHMERMLVVCLLSCCVNRNSLY